MENKFKIIVSYIKDLSVEIPSPEALVTIRNTIPEYKMKVDIKSKPLKRKMIEVLTTLTYENPNKKKEKGFFQIAYANVIDTLELARNKFPGSGISLDALCKRYRIDNSRRTKHNALMDCDLLAKVYINLIDQKEPTLNLVDNSENNISSSQGGVEYFKKVIKPTEQELSNHKEFLKKNLKKNFF